MGAITRALHSLVTSSLCATLAAALVFLVPGVRVASAGIVGTSGILESSAGVPVSGIRDRLHRVVDREEVTRQLASAGISADEAHRRIEALSDREVAELDGRISELPAGQGAVSVVVGAILIVFFVLLFTDLIGATDVFPWVNKH